MKTLKTYPGKSFGIMAWAIILTMIGCTRCRTCNFNLPSDIAFGGRASCVAIKPGSSGNEIWVGSETGGLFSSGDGGQHWQHVNKFPTVFIHHIKFCPTDPNIIVVTAGHDTKVDNGGGIWVSTNGGSSWTHPADAVPPVSNRRPKLYDAYGICYSPNGNRVYVGTDYGIAFSSNKGINWSYIFPDTTNAVNYYKNQNAVWSVLALSNNKVITYGAEGIWISNNGTSLWHHDATGMASGWGGLPDALDVSPNSNNHIFFTNNWDQLFFSSNGGENFTAVASLPPGAYDASRVPFVKAAHVHDESGSNIELYYCNKSIIYRKKLTPSGGSLSFSGSWNSLDIKHYDPSDLAFDEALKNPLVATSDGGIAISADGGNNFTMTGKPINGYNALQVFNVKLVKAYGGGSKSHQYFGTQDNSFWASRNNGGSWPFPTGNEGYNIMSTDAFNAGSADSDVYYHCICGVGGWFKSLPMYVSPAEVTYPDSFISIDHIRVKNRTLFTCAKGNLAYNKARTSFNAGGSWQVENVAINYTLNNFAQAATTGGNTTMYVPYLKAGSLPNGAQRWGLLKMGNMVDGSTSNGTVSVVSGISSLGILATMWPWYCVYGVSPTDPNYIIVPDVETGMMRVTHNGGTNWTNDTALTNMVTDTGKLYFYSENGSVQARAITWDPANPNHILIGTYQAGIIFSRDGGSHWHKIEGTEQIPLITSFQFESDTSAFVSTYGRGLWNIKFIDVPGNAPLGPQAPAPMAQSGSGSSMMAQMLKEREQNFEDKEAQNAPRIEIKGYPSAIPSIPLYKPIRISLANFAQYKPENLVFTIDGMRTKYGFKDINETVVIKGFTSAGMHEIIISDRSKQEAVPVARLIINTAFSDEKYYDRDYKPR